MKPTDSGQSQSTSSISEKLTLPVETKKGKMAHSSVVVSDADTTTKTVGAKRKFSETEPVTDREIGLPNTFADFSRSAASLHKALFKSSEFKRQPFKLYSIGGSDTAAVVSMEPDIDHAALFWHVFERCGCKIILNINNAGAGEEYYPQPNQFLNLEELEISREEIEDSNLLAAFKGKRPRSDRESVCEHLALKVSGGLSLQTELFRIKNWQDGEGYDPNRAIAIARALPLGETMVHCLAGLGRTGTMVTIMQLVDLADHDLLPTENAVDTLVGFIQGNRYDREDNHFVTSSAQFNCLLQVVQILTGLSEQEVAEQVQKVIKSRLKS